MPAVRCAGTNDRRRSRNGVAPFDPDGHECVVVKIIEDRGVESFEIVEVG